MLQGLELDSGGGGQGAAGLAGHVAWRAAVVPARNRSIAARATVTPVTGQGSHQIASLAKADVLIVVPEAETELAAGAEVEILELP